MSKDKQKPVVYYTKLEGIEEIDSHGGIRAHVTEVTAHHTLTERELVSGGGYVRTSQILKHDVETGDIETVNTLYKRR